MHSPAFVQVNYDEHHDKIFAITMEYFDWMKNEIETVCNLSIQELVGQSLEEYVQGTVKTVCSGVPPEGVFYLVQEADHTVGSGGLRRLSDDSVEIVRIFTRPQYRGRGYGRQLMARLLSDACVFGYSLVKLDTGNFMRSAHRIYESFGFNDCEPYEGAEPPPQLVPYWRYMSKKID
jgi:GNAT superfamily N-acetyltransferase